VREVIPVVNRMYPRPRLQKEKDSNVWESLAWIRPKAFRRLVFRVYLFILRRPRCVYIRSLDMPEGIYQVYPRQTIPMWLDHKTIHLQNAQMFRRMTFYVANPNGD